MINRRTVLRTTGAVLVGSHMMSSNVGASGTFTSESYDGRSYKRYVPSGYDGSTPVPLLVMLHGCLQDPSQFAAGTRMNVLAESEGFIVIYPEQTLTANASRCWNWFEPEHQTRGAGEPALIAGMTRQTAEDYAIDSERTYLIGFSAGGAMASIMAVAYPDLYAGVGIHSGAEYDAADSLLEAGAVVAFGGPDPQVMGTNAYEDMGERAQVVRTIVFHGTDDYVIDPENGHQATEQAIQMNDLASDGSDDDAIDAAEEHVVSESRGHTYTVDRYADSGTTLVAKCIVEEMGHAWSGGAPGGVYTDPDAPDASRLMWSFFDG